MKRARRYGSLGGDLGRLLFFFVLGRMLIGSGHRRVSVRGFLAGAVKKKLGLRLLSEKPDAGPRRYRIASTV